MTCSHNARSRYEDGFFCNDCNKFFGKDSPTYRSGELISSIWTALHNLYVINKRNGGQPFNDVLAMRDKIGIGIKHSDYEALIAEAEIVMRKYGITMESAYTPLDCSKK